MGSLFNSIGALIAGSLLILTIVSSIFKTRVYGNDTSMYLVLNGQSERIVHVLQSRYLANLGAGVSDSLVIKKANTNQFVFLATNNQYQTKPDTITVEQLNKTDDGYPFQVKVNSRIDMGPFYMQYPLVIEYFDHDDNKLSNPNSSLDIIRSSSFSLSFKAPAQQENQVIVSKIKFWEYFKNLYF